MMQSFSAQSLEETKRIAQHVAQYIQKGDLILLSGPVGCGKSEFCRAIIQHCIQKDIPVPSPTYSIVHSYETPKISLWHMDLYRLSHYPELTTIGFSDALHKQTTFLIEWPNLLLNQLPPNKRILHITISLNNESRHFKLDSCGHIPYALPGSASLF